MTRTLQSVAEAAHGRLVGADSAFGAVASDSRRMEVNALFVCLEGVHFDGHDFARAAEETGAAGLLTHHDVETALPQVRVKDTLAGLADFAHAWRQAHTVRTVGVTGSNGKTTVKNLLAAVFAQVAPTLATSGNYNNLIGVPLTLARLNSEHRFAVVEMGTNTPGEIARLAEIAVPDAAVVVSIAPAHLEGFGDVAGVAREKGALFASLPEDGLAVAPADSPWLDDWQRASRVKRWLGFGLDETADVRAQDIETTASGTRFTLVTPAGEAPAELQLLGRHNVINALAAAAVAWGLGVDTATIARGLAIVRPAAGRLVASKLPSGAMLIDDTYNANPVSVSAAIDAAVASGRPVWVALGDLGELGADAVAWHVRIGREAREVGVRKLYTLGPLAAAAAEAYGEGGQAFEDVHALTAALVEALPADAVLVVKGSRAARMERVVQALATVREVC
ncbi:MAG: UDP-N-acetylmuramoyl-tripeptide--D-alanyl-D-alanine ligase [Gammaproteobacteria bacterium]